MKKTILPYFLAFLLLLSSGCNVGRSEMENGAVEELEPYQNDSWQDAALFIKIDASSSNSGHNYLNAALQIPPGYQYDSTQSIEDAIIFQSACSDTDEPWQGKELQFSAYGITEESSPEGTILTLLETRDFIEMRLNGYPAYIENYPMQDFAEGIDCTVYCGYFTNGSVIVSVSTYGYGSGDDEIITLLKNVIGSFAFDEITAGNDTTTSYGCSSGGNMPVDNVFFDSNKVLEIDISEIGAADFHFVNARGKISVDTTAEIVNVKNNRGSKLFSFEEMLADTPAAGYASLGESWQMFMSQGKYKEEEPSQDYFLLVGTATGSDGKFYTFISKLDVTEMEFVQGVVAEGYSSASVAQNNLLSVYGESGETPLIEIWIREEPAAGSFSRMCWELGIDPAKTYSYIHQDTDPSGRNSPVKKWVNSVRSQEDADVYVLQHGAASEMLYHLNFSGDVIEVRMINASTGQELITWETGLLWERELDYLLQGERYSISLPKIAWDSDDYAYNPVDYDSVQEGPLKQTDYTEEYIGGDGLGYGQDMDEIRHFVEEFETLQNWLTDLDALARAQDFFDENIRPYYQENAPETRIDHFELRLTGKQIIYGHQCYLFGAYLDDTYQGIHIAINVKGNLVFVLEQENGTWQCAKDNNQVNMVNTVYDQRYQTVTMTSYREYSRHVIQNGAYQIIWEEAGHITLSSPYLDGPVDIPIELTEAFDSVDYPAGTLQENSDIYLYRQTPTYILRLQSLRTGLRTTAPASCDLTWRGRNLWNCAYLPLVS